MRAKQTTHLKLFGFGSIAESVVRARPWQCFQFLHVVQVCIDSNQVAFAIIDNCQMNNIGIRPTFKNKKTQLYFSFDWISLSVYEWGKPCLLLILSPRLCLVCCFSVFVPTPSLWPKIIFTSRGWVGARAPSGSFLNKLPIKWYFVQRFMESYLSESRSAPPLAPPDILKSMHTSLDFFSQYDKVDKSPISYACLCQ